MVTSPVDSEPGEFDQHAVLVVEDIEALRGHIVETIEELGRGLVVEQAADGQEALEMIQARSEPYRLVVTDISMPRMDGEELIARLRDDDYPVPVVVLTAHGEEELIVRCLKQGACDYLVKPVSVDDLQVAVTTALQHMPIVSTDLTVDYDPHGWFEVSGPTDYSVLYRFRKFLTLLDCFQLTDEHANEVKLALEELGRNAIEWGNKGDATKQVRFGCRILPYKIIVQIADQGDGFHPEGVPDPTADPFGHIEQRRAEGKRLGGYGIHLIRNLMDKVVWNARGNVVVAIKYLDKPAKTAAT